MNLSTYEKLGRTEYEALAKAIADILFAAIQRYGDLRLQQVQHRAKHPDSLSRKLERDGALETAEIEAAVKDLAGARLVFYTNSDVTRLLSSGIITDNFDVDWDRTKIHHPSGDAAQASELFVSNNYVVKLKDDRLALPEYARFAGMACEVQVQTTLNHAWAEMAHDTIYKKPDLPGGFGGDLMRDIETRMAAIMRNHLMPAGYEFQKVLTDFERLSSGKQIFDQGGLAAIAAAADNNQRYDVLERFATYVLPHYDDPQPLSAEILETVVAAVTAARATPTLPIETPFGSFQGRTADDVAGLAEGVIERLRYVNVEAAFDTICQLYPGAATDQENKIWLNAAQKLAKNELQVWEQVGPGIQTLLVQLIQALPRERQGALRPILLTVLQEVLSPEVSGTSSTHDTITLSHGAIAASEELRQTRGTAIDLLTSLCETSDGDTQRREVIHALKAASSMPHVGELSSALAVMVLSDARRVVDFYTRTANDLSFELRQEIEHDLLWMYRHRAKTNPGGEDGPVAAAHENLLQAILAFRDRVNADPKFIVYKTLVGYNSVFPPAWADPEFDYEGEEAYRREKIAEFVASASAETADHWLSVIRRCAATKSYDLATFPNFHAFLVDLGRAKPDVTIGYLKQIDDQLAPFLHPLLLGLTETAEWPQAQGIVRSFVRERRYLREIAWALRTIRHLDASLLAEILAVAVEAGDGDAALSVMAAATARHDDPQPQIIKAAMLRAITYLGAKRDTRWVNAFWPRPAKNPLLLTLDEAETVDLLTQLVPHPRVEHNVEELLVSLAERWPRRVIEFFGHRIRFRRSERLTDYEAVPYELHALPRALKNEQESLLAAARGWFGEDPTHFQFSGGQLVSNIFPAFSEQLEALLLARVGTGDRDEISFVLSILRAYDGQTFLHRACKEVVAVLPPDDPLIGAVRIVLSSMGVTTGEFGRVAAFKRKRSEIESWLADPRERVRAFAQSYLRSLDNEIASEQRRSEEELALRKLAYEEPGEGVS